MPPPHSSPPLILALLAAANAGGARRRQPARGPVDHRPRGGRRPHARLDVRRRRGALARPHPRRVAALAGGYAPPPLSPPVSPPLSSPLLSPLISPPACGRGRSKRTARAARGPSTPTRWTRWAPARARGAAARRCASRARRSGWCDPPHLISLPPLSQVRVLPISPFLDAHMSLTPLHYAAWGGQLECTNMVLKSCKPYAANPPTPKAGGASPPLADDDDTLTESPLLLAARGTAGAAPVVQLLAAEGFTDHRALGHAATHTVRIGLLEAALLRHSEFMSLCATPRHAAPHRLWSSRRSLASTRRPAHCPLPPASCPACAGSAPPHALAPPRPPRPAMSQGARPVCAAGARGAEVPEAARRRAVQPARLVLVLALPRRLDGAAACRIAAAAALSLRLSLRLLSASPLCVSFSLPRPRFLSLTCPSPLPRRSARSARSRRSARRRCCGAWRRPC